MYTKVLDQGSNPREVAPFLSDSEEETRKKQAERAKSMKSSSSLDVAHKVSADKLTDKYRNLQVTLQRERDMFRENVEMLRADNQYYVDQYQKLNVEYAKTVTELYKFNKRNEEHSDYDDDAWNSQLHTKNQYDKQYTDSMLSLNSNVVTTAHTRTIIGPSDSYLVHKFQTGGSTSRMESSGEAVPPLAGEHTKVNFKNLLAYLVNTYKECKHFSANDKKDFEMIMVWHKEEALASIELPGQIKRNILLYYYLFLHGWKAALELIKPYDQQSFGLPPVTINISNHTHMHNKPRYNPPARRGGCYRGRGGRGGSRGGPKGKTLNL